MVRAISPAEPEELCSQTTRQGTRYNVERLGSGIFRPGHRIEPNLMRPVLFYTDHYALPLPEGHRFPIRKYRLVREALAANGGFDLRPALLAKPEIVELAHDSQYVRDFLSGVLSAAAVRRIGFPWSQELVQRTLASVGATLAATKQSVENGFSGTLAGGTHHAFRSEGSGYCVFNDIAVAIEWLRRKGRHSHFAVIDLDVH